MTHLRIVLAVLASFLAACSGIKPHGNVTIDTPGGPVDIRFADAAGPKVGVFVAHQESDGQWAVFKKARFSGIYDRYIAPCGLRAGDQVMYKYPFTDRGRWDYKFSDCYRDSGLWALSDRLHKQGIEFIVYVPKPVPADGNLKKLTALFESLPPTCSVAFDELNSSSPAGWEMIAAQRAKGRKIYGEPMAFTYQPKGQGFPYVENSDHYDWHASEPTRHPTATTLMLHHKFPEGWDYGACALEWARECFARNQSAMFAAEPLVNAAPPLTISNVDPRQN